MFSKKHAPVQSEVAAAMQESCLESLWPFAKIRLDYIVVVLVLCSMKHIYISVLLEKAVEAFFLLLYLKFVIACCIYSLPT